MSYVGKIPRETIKRIRDYHIAHPDVLAKDIAGKLGLHMSETTMGYILRNDAYRDPEYVQPKRVPFVSAHQVALIRTFKLNNPTFGATAVKNCLRLSISRQLVCAIMYNTVYVDPTYTPPITERTSTPWGDSKRPKRLASIDCKFTCPTCGMGAETEAEAEACCKRAKEA